MPTWRKVQHWSARYWRYPELDHRTFGKGLTRECRVPIVPPGMGANRDGITGEVAGTAGLGIASSIHSPAIRGLPNG
jgi:hypothetical protein